MEWDFVPGFGVREFTGSPDDPRFPGPCVTLGKCSVGTIVPTEYVGYGPPNNQRAVDAAPGTPSHSFALMSTDDFLVDWDGTPGDDLITTLQSAIWTPGGELPATGFWELEFDFAFLTNSDPANSNDFATIVVLEDEPPFDNIVEEVEIFRVSRSEVGSTYASVSCGSGAFGGIAATYDLCTDDGDATDGDRWINKSLDLNPFLGSRIGVRVLIAEGDHSLSAGEEPADVDDGFPSTLLFDNLQVVQKLQALGAEGSAVTLDLLLEPGATAPVFTWNFTEVPTVCTIADGSSQNPSITCPDDAEFDVSVQVDYVIDDFNFEVGTAWGTVTVENTPPTVAALSGFPNDPIQIGSTVTATGSFTDNGADDTHTATIDWGDGSPLELVSVDQSTGQVGPAMHVYSRPGDFAPILVVSDDDGGFDQATFEFVTVDDQFSGFVVGAGLIDSPAGSYTAAPTFAGKAAFGFVVTHKRGQAVGAAHFKFPAARLDFQSTSIDWLVVSGQQMKFKGTGTIGGVGHYGFMISATDATRTVGSRRDRFRIQIWDENDGDALVYDNERGSGANSDPTTMIGLGAIEIHRK
jgi:hypothetical protein